MFIVVREIINPIAPIPYGIMIWKARSPVLSECLATRKEVTVVRAHGGAQRSSEIVREYPIVAVSVGKYALKLSPTT